MNKTTHTLAPWKLDGDIVRSSDGSCIAKVSTFFNIADPEGEANARLIAAAPELLSALQELLSCNKEFRSFFPDLPDVEKPSPTPVQSIADNVTREILAEERAAAAIARATGL